MKKILITKDSWISVDDEDQPLLKERKLRIITYHSIVHVYISYFNYDEKRVRQMRLDNFLAPHPRGYFIAHKNNDILDFRKENLLLINKSKRLQINSLRNANRSGFKGVSWDKENGKWKAQITYMKKNYNLGRYAQIKNAALAYNKKALDLFGEGSWLNDVDSWEAKMQMDAQKAHLIKRVRSGIPASDRYKTVMRRFTDQLLA